MDTKDSGVIAILSVSSSVLFVWEQIWAKLSTCVFMHMCARVCVCAYILEGHTWLQIGKSDVKDVQPGRARTDTAAHCLCVSFLPKSTLDGDVVMWDPPRWWARRWGFLLTRCCDCGFAVSISSPTTLVFVDLPVSPTCSLQSRTKKGQGCWRIALYFTLVTCKHSQTQRQTTELWGKYSGCLFSVVVVVLLSDFFFFFFSLSH